MRRVISSPSTAPERPTVATFPTYQEAQRAIDVLSDSGFPVQKTAIVAHDIRFVEQVVGRRGVMSAAFEGMLDGAGIGAVVGFLLGLFSLFEPVVSAFALAFWGLLLGAVVGFIVGLVTHGLTFGRRDFASVGTLQASHLDVVADHDVADQAAKHLRDARLLMTPKR